MFTKLISHFKIFYFDIFMREWHTFIHRCTLSAQLPLDNEVYIKINVNKFDNG